MDNNTSYEENNPPDIDESVVEATVRSCLPHIKNPNIRFHYHGTYNVFIVEDEYVFRFPSTILPLSEQHALIRHEAVILSRLPYHLTFKIPKPEFIDMHTDSPYMAYRMIPGLSLSPLYDTTTSEQQRFLGAQVGEFLSDLHTIDITDLRLEDGASYNPEEDRSAMRRMFSEIQDIVFPNISAEAINWTEKLFTDILDDDENFQFDPVLVHGDFDTSNILVNPESFFINGIIDFEETRVFDPAVDLLFLSEGSIFLKGLLGSYQGTIDSHFRNRINFRYGRQPFIYILWGTNHGLETMVDCGYRYLKQYMQRWDEWMAVADQCFGANNSVK
jgi:aminoglycoside 2''-phosphotransferase